MRPAVDGALARGEPAPPTRADGAVGAPGRASPTHGGAVPSASLPRRAWPAALAPAPPAGTALLKVCGLREPEEVERLAGLGVDLLGVRIRASDDACTRSGGRRAGRASGGASPHAGRDEWLEAASPHAAHDESLEAALRIARAAHRIARATHRRPRLVAVALDSRFDRLARILETLRPAAIQLHGFDLPACAARLKAAFPEVAVLEVLHVAGGRCLEEALLEHYVASGVDAFVLDSFASLERPGSTGTPIDLEVVERIVPRLGGVPYLIAGGCRAASIPAIRARTGAAGIDVDTAAREAGRLSGRRVRDLLAACRLPLGAETCPAVVFPPPTLRRPQSSRPADAQHALPPAAAGERRGVVRRPRGARAARLPGVVAS